MAESNPDPDCPSLREAFFVWLKIGLLSFGGPAGQIALMHRVLVEEKRWISEARFLHALNYVMFLPGPEAQQLAIYAGWLLHRRTGGLIAGILFVLPGAIVMLILSVLYAGFRDLSLVEAFFFGIKAAVLAIVVQAVIRLGRRAISNSAMLAIAAFSFAGIFFFTIPFPLIIMVAALTGLVGSCLAPTLFEPADRNSPAAQTTIKKYLVDRLLESGNLTHIKPSLPRALRVSLACLVLWLSPIFFIGGVLGPDHVFTQEGVFFSKMAVVTFGGAYAVLAYVAQQAVDLYGWLAPGEMLNGLGLAETTPGPLIMVVQYVGFLGAFRNPGSLDPFVAGVLGSLLTTWVTFVPCFLWIFAGAPYIEVLRNKSLLNGALGAITAAVVGVVLYVAVWFGLNVCFEDIREVWVGQVRLLIPELSTAEPAVLVITTMSLFVTLKYKVGILPMLASAAVIGMACFYGIR